MKNLIEFDVVVYLQDDKVQKEMEKYMEMGVHPPEQEQQEKIVKYAFDCSNIIEVRQTFVMYKGGWKDAIVATISEPLYETPPLLTTYKAFKEKVNEHNKKNTETQ